MQQRGINDLNRMWRNALPGPLRILVDNRAEDPVLCLAAGLTTAATASDAAFQPSAAFTGERAGYYFSMGPSGSPPPPPSFPGARACPQDADQHATPGCCSEGPRTQLLVEGTSSLYLV